MPRKQPVGEVNDQADKEQPHGREMPLQRASEALFIVPVLRNLGLTAQCHPYRKRKAEQRLLVVDTPPAADHYEDCDRIEPVSDPHYQRMQHIMCRAQIWCPG